MKEIKIILVDDHTMVRQGICQSFQMEKNFKVVGETDSGRSAVNLVSKYCPDIVIMDVSMPDLNGIETTKQILADNSNVKVIALSVHSEKVYVMGMLNAGASGYLLKSCSFKELYKAISIVLSGKMYLCTDVTHLVIKSSLESVHNQSPSALSVLSRGEREVLQLISEGHKNNVIAEKLNIGLKTVETHRLNQKKKLDIHSVAGLTKFAISEGITSYDL